LVLHEVSAPRLCQAKCPAVVAGTGAEPAAAAAVARDVEGAEEDVAVAVVREMGGTSCVCRLWLLERPPPPPESFRATNQKQKF